jgi:hypothetical protein
LRREFPDSLHRNRSLLRISLWVSNVRPDSFVHEETVRRDSYRLPFIFGREKSSTAQDSGARSIHVDVGFQPTGCLLPDKSAAEKFTQQHVKMMDAILALYGISAAVVG